MVWVNVCCESVSTTPFQWFIEVLSLDGVLKATSLGTYFTSSAVLLSTSAISGPCCMTHLCPPSVQSLLRPCSHPSLFIAFQCLLIAVDLWHSHPKQSANSSLSSDLSSQKLALVFPSCFRSYWNCWGIPITTKDVSSLWQGHSLSPRCSKILMWLWSN